MKFPRTRLKPNLQLSLRLKRRGERPGQALAECLKGGTHGQCPWIPNQTEGQVFPEDADKADVEDLFRIELGAGQFGKRARGQVIRNHGGELNRGIALVTKIRLLVFFETRVFNILPCSGTVFQKSQGQACNRLKGGQRCPGHQGNGDEQSVLQGSQFYVFKPAGLLDAPYNPEIKPLIQEAFPDFFRVKR